MTNEDELIVEFHQSCEEITKDICNIDLSTLNAYPFTELFSPTLKAGIAKAKETIAQAYSGFQNKYPMAENYNKIKKIATSAIPLALDQFTQNYYQALSTFDNKAIGEAVQKILGIELETIVFSLYFDQATFVENENRKQALASFKAYVMDQIKVLKCFLNQKDSKTPLESMANCKADNKLTAEMEPVSLSPEEIAFQYKEMRKNAKKINKTAKFLFGVTDMNDYDDYDNVKSSALTLNVDADESLETLMINGSKASSPKTAA